ncbi:TonB-dependent siderophore receptor [Pseudomonadota bacterium AL_CKDN230030165-1A_HGKHYDSX7]
MSHDLYSRRRGTSPVTRSSSSFHRLCRPTVLAALLAGPAFGALVAPASAQQAAPAAREFRIGAGTLDQVLGQFGTTANVLIAIDPALTQGKRSAGLEGRHSVEQGLARVLQGTGLLAVAEGPGKYRLRADPAQGGVAVLPALTVSGRHTDQVVTEGDRSYGTPAIMLGKRTQSLQEIPQSVSVVTRQLLDDRAITSLGEAMEITPGITVQDTNSYERAYYSRGYKIENIQFDGVPTQSGSGFLTQPDMAIYDHVEVLRGPAGLYNGAGEPGGTVNLVRKRPTADFAVSGKVSAGSWNNYRGEFDVGGPLNESGSVRGRMVAAYQDKDEFYDISNTQRTVFYGIAEADITPDTVASVGLSYERNRMTPFYGGVPRFSDGGDIGLPRDTYFNAAWSRARFERTTVFADMSHRFNDDWRLRVAATRAHERSHDYSGSAFGTVNRATGLGATLSAFDQTGSSVQHAIDASIEGSFEALGQRHDVLLGANYWERDYDSTSALYTPDNPRVNVYDFDPRDYSDFPTRLARTPSRSNAVTEQGGLYGSLRLSLADPLKLTLGGRLSNYRSSSQNLVTGVTTRAKDSGEFTPYGALSYDITPDWTTYVSYTEIFRSQATSFKADGSPLDPATGENYEIGLKGAMLDGRLNGSVALFRTIENGRSQTDPNSPAPCLGSPTGGACFINDGKVRSQGFELELTGSLTPSWNVIAGYTFNTTKYLRDRTATGAASANEGGSYSTFTPRHIFRVWSNYRLPGEWNAIDVGGGVRLQSASYKTVGAIRLEQGGYAIWDGRIGYRINRNLQAALNVNNIFDKKYYRTLGSLNGSNWYGEPRSVMLTLTAQY